MTYRFKNISGSLNALLVFEAVVRNLSFTRAGAELNLSQPTVSRHIATLESRLNQSLFTRVGNQVLPTSEANQLASAIALGFGHAETAWEAIQAEAQENEVTLACSFGFAENWLMSRYTGLKQALGTTRLRMATFDKPEYMDMSRIDIAVVWDISAKPERSSIPLFTEQAFPICSPRYLHDHPRIANNTEALTQADLLHFEVGDSGFINWRLWFAAQGVDYRMPDNVHQYDTLPFVMQAVLDGEGVGIGWRYLVDHLLDNERVVQVGPALSNRKAAYYLQYREEPHNVDAINIIIDWFKQEIKQDKPATES